MKEEQSLFPEFPPITTEEWESVIERDLKGADYEKKLVWKTLEGFKVKPYYRAEDLEKLGFVDTYPDEMPFVRGQKTKGNDWDIREEITGCSLSELRSNMADALRRGAGALGVDMQCVQTRKDLETLLAGIDLAKVKLHFKHAASYLQLMQNFVAYIQAGGYDGETVRGSIDFDPFAFALTYGEYRKSEQAGYEEWHSILKVARPIVPHFDLLTVHGDIYHNAGGNIVEELGFTLSAAHEYLYRLTAMGIPAHSVGYRTVFHFATGSNYFMEIAKIRAARMLWSKIMEQYTPKCETAYKLHIHTETSRWNTTVYDSYVNLLRTTTETMSAAIGGVDSISVLPFDIAYATPSDFGKRIATNQQILLKEEAYMDKVVDPSAGSYYVENLTDSIAAYAWEVFREIENNGGFSKAIAKGMVQERIKATAAQRDKNIATRKTVILGTNQYPNLKETGEHVSAMVSHAQQLPGQQTIPVLVSYRGAEAFEQLRLATEKSDHRPKVFLLTYGNLAMRKARAGFATNFFGVAGYEIIDNAGFDTPEEGAEAALLSKPDVVVLCSSDDEYGALVEKVCLVLKGKIPALVVAGNPVEQMETFRSAGIDEFIHVRTNVLDCLQAFQKKLLK